MLDCGHSKTAHCFNCEKQVVPNYDRESGRYLCPECKHVFSFYSPSGQKILRSEREDREYFAALGIVLEPVGEDYWAMHDRLEKRGLKPHFQICPDCEAQRPSRRKAAIMAPLTSAIHDLGEKRSEIEKLEEILEAHGDGSFYVCPQCDEVVDESELCVVRQCSKDGCEATFDGDSNGRNCPDCNSPFTRRFAEKGHNDCADNWTDGEECEQVEVNQERIDALKKEADELERAALDTRSEVERKLKEAGFNA